MDVAGSTGLGVGGGAGMGGGGAGRGGEAARGPVQKKRGKETEVPDLGMVGAKLRKEFASLRKRGMCPVTKGARACTTAWCTRMVMRRI